MQYIQNKNIEDFDEIFVHQRGARECWFACCCMLCKLRTPGLALEYDMEKQAFYQTKSYQKYAEFYLEAKLDIPDPMQNGASSDLVCCYLNEIPQSASTTYHIENFIDDNEKFEAIKRNLDAGYPVIIGYANFHDMIVIGYDDDRKELAYLDPRDSHFVLRSAKMNTMNINEVILGL
ncbi:MAG: BtrH N-terminal domain-containing protein [Clostridiales bacterium]|jgi:hypothetical protein|nr:BtrH N-terminal domain-containing protein [Clostridiales bacterium]